MSGTMFIHATLLCYAMTGIRAEVRIHSPEGCPVVGVSEAADAPSTSVTRAVDDETVTEEFVLHTDRPPDPDPTGIEDGVEEVFAYGSKRAYRFQRQRDDDCPCEDIEAHDCPLLETYVRDGSLVVVFHATDLDHLRDVLTDMKARWSNVSVHRLIQSGDERGERDLVFADRGELTDRQTEVLETAHEMGYFDHPKGANATEVAEELGITQATFAEHLAAAQRKLLSSILES